MAGILFGRGAAPRLFAADAAAAFLNGNGGAEPGVETILAAESSAYLDLSEDKFIHNAIFHRNITYLHHAIPHY